MDLYHGIQNKQAQRQRGKALCLAGVELRAFPRYGNFLMGAAVILADTAADGAALADFCTREGLHAFVFPWSADARRVRAVGDALRERAKELWIDPRKMQLVASGATALMALLAAQGEDAPFVRTASHWALPQEAAQLQLDKPAFFACPASQADVAVRALRPLERQGEVFELHVCCDLADLNIPAEHPSPWMSALGYWLKGV